jgi:hypothetical protein
MGLRLGFRLAPHLYLSVPLGHPRRLARHNGHGERLDPIQTAVGAVIVVALAVLLARPMAYALLFAVIVWLL